MTRYQNEYILFFFFSDSTTFILICNLDVQSFAEFPGVFAEIQDGLIKVEELRQNSTRMTASMADTANLARSLIVQAEDSRLLMHMYKNI